MKKLFTKALQKSIPSREIAENATNPMIWACFWCPRCGDEWYVAGYDPEDSSCYGIFDGWEICECQFYLKETCEACDSKLIRDTQFVPRPLEQLYMELGEALPEERE